MTHPRRGAMTGGPEPAPAGAPVGFWVEVKPQRETVQVIPTGELDLATVERLKSELEKLLDVGFTRIVLDLRRLEFLDSTGLHAMISAHARAKNEGWQLAIIPGSRAVQRIFELTGATEQLPFTPISDGAGDSEARDPGSLPPT